MEGIQPAKFSDEARNGLAAAVAGEPEQGSPVAVEPATVPAVDPSIDPAAAESAVVTEPTEQPTESTEQVVTGDEPSAEAEAAKGPIPYERFREVNEKRKQLELDLKAAQVRGADPTVIDAMAQDRSRAMLAQIAAQHPELNKVIFGDPEAARIANLPALDPNDPVHARLIALESAQRAQGQHLQNFNRQQLIESMEDRAETRMESHPIFADSDVRNIGETLIAQKLLANPKLPVETVVDDIAKQLRGLQEKTKAAYVKAKVAVPAKVAPGVGSGNAAPPGVPSGAKFAFGGSARKAFEAAMRAEKTA